MKFHVLGKGFIYSKHAEAIKAVGGVEVDSYDARHNPRTVSRPPCAPGA